MKTIPKQNEQRSTLLSHVMRWVHHRQRRFADLLSDRYERLSQRGKKISLLLFGLMMAGASLYLIGSPGESSNVLAEVNAQLPVAILDQPRQELITLQEYRQLLSFRDALDSLHEVNPALYDQMIRERKGLLDSLELLIRIFQKQ